MNREIKFRVWDKVDYMSNPFTLDDIQLKKIQFTSDCVVMQFTGLLDKNGKEIYEGDIVKMLSGEICTIVYSGAGFKYNYITMDEAGLKRQLSASIAKYLEVIGTIHQNPELLQA